MFCASSHEENKKDKHIFSLQRRQFKAEPEWFKRLEGCAAARSIMGLSPMQVPYTGQNGLGGGKCCTKGESEESIAYR